MQDTHSHDLELTKDDFEFYIKQNNIVPVHVTLTREYFVNTRLFDNMITHLKNHCFSYYRIDYFAYDPIIYFVDETDASTFVNILL